MLNVFTDRNACRIFRSYSFSLQSVYLSAQSSVRVQSVAEAFRVAGVAAYGTRCVGDGAAAAEFCVGVWSVVTSQADDTVTITVACQF